MTRLARAWRRSSREQRLAAVAALALLVTMLLPWYGLQSLNRRSGRRSSYPQASAPSATSRSSRPPCSSSRPECSRCCFARAEGRDFQPPRRRRHDRDGRRRLGGPADLLPRASTSPPGQRLSGRHRVGLLPRLRGRRRPRLRRLADAQAARAALTRSGVATGARGPRGPEGGHRAEPVSLPGPPLPPEPAARPPQPAPRRPRGQRRDGALIPVGREPAAPPSAASPPRPSPGSPPRALPLSAPAGRARAALLRGPPAERGLAASGRACPQRARRGPAPIIGRTMSDASPPEPTSVAEVAAGLRAVGYLPGESTALVSYLATKLGKPVLVEGPAGVGKTELAKALAALPRPRARAAAVLRGPGRGQGAVRVELPQAAAAHPGRGHRHRLGRRPGGHLRRGVPARAAADDRDRLRAAGGAADRRDRQDRPGVRGDAAGGALRLPDLDPRARPGRVAHAPGRAAHLEQLARADRGAEAPLPVPVARLPGARARARNRAPARARALRDGGAPAGRGDRHGARPRPEEAAVDRRVDRLGAGAAAARASRTSTRTPSPRRCR